MHCLHLLIYQMWLYCQLDLQEQIPPKYDSFFHEHVFENTICQ